VPSILLNAMYYMVFIEASGRDGWWVKASNVWLRGGL
jgi:hypothetical protein